jgi:hypothetical protein
LTRDPIRVDFDSIDEVINDVILLMLTCCVQTREAIGIERLEESDGGDSCRLSGKIDCVEITEQRDVALRADEVIARHLLEVWLEKIRVWKS